MEEPFRLDVCPALRADTEEGAVRAVHADGSGRAGVRHRLSVDEGARVIEVFEDASVGSFPGISNSFLVQKQTG